MNNRNIQRKDSAGHTKLTAVTIGHGTNKKQFFVPLKHNADGSAVLPHRVLDKMLTEANVRHGDTYTVG